MSKMIKINEEIILYTNKLEKKVFDLIQDEIGQKLDQIVGLNIFKNYNYVYKSEGMVPTGDIKIIGGIAADEVKNIKNIVNEIREIINENRIRLCT